LRAATPSAHRSAALVDSSGSLATENSIAALNFSHTRGTAPQIVGRASTSAAASWARSGTTVIWVPKYSCRYSAVNRSALARRRWSAPRSHRIDRRNALERGTGGIRFGHRTSQSLRPDLLPDRRSRRDARVPFSPDFAAALDLESPTTRAVYPTAGI